MEKQPFVTERVYEAPASNVWKAITEPELLKQWYFDIPEFRAEPGFEFSFEGNGPCERPNTHLCRVTEVIMGKKLSYTWRYEGYEGDSLVTFELFEEGKNTRVRLTHKGLETFPADLLAKKNLTGGWALLIGDYLKSFLENGLPDKDLLITGQRPSRGAEV